MPPIFARPSITRRLALLAALSAAAGGCRAAPDHSALDVTSARAHVREQALALEDLSAAVSLSIETAEHDGSLDVSLSGALLVEPPEKLRLRATKFMQDVFDLVITSSELDLYWFDDRTWFRRRLGTDAAMPATEGATSESPKEQSPEAFLARLDGRALRLSLSGFELPRAEDASPLPPADRVVAEFYSREGGSFVVREQLAGGDRLERRFDGTTLFLEQVTLAAADGRKRLRVTYDDYEPVGLHWLATSMELEDQATGTTFEMSLDDIVVNEGVLPGAFTLAPPPGVKVREL